MGDMYTEYKEYKQNKKMSNAVNSEDILIKHNIVFKKCTEFHYVVGGYNFYPSTGLYVHKKTNKRGRGIFNLLKLIEAVK